MDKASGTLLRRASRRQASDSRCSVAGRAVPEASDSALRPPPASVASARGAATMLRTQRLPGGVQRSVQLVQAAGRASWAAHPRHSSFADRLDEAVSVLLTAGGAFLVSRPRWARW